MQELNGICRLLAGSPLRSVKLVKLFRGRAVRGHLDTWDGGFVAGWAFDPSNPKARLTIEVLLDGAIVATAVADEYRSDLAPAGVGDGKHAFHIPFPAAFADAKTRTLDVRVKGMKGPFSKEARTVAMPAPVRPQTGRKIVFDTMPAPTASSPAIHTGSPEISLILPTFNRGEIMERTVESFAACAQRVSAEIIIVDDGSSDDTPARLKRLASKHAIIRYERVPNAGPARARNLAASTARGDVLLFVGDDVAPIDDRFIENHLVAHRRIASASVAVLGKITWPNMNDFPTSFVMFHVQGDGQQQFGYKYLEPYASYDWRFFYSSNASVKRTIIGDWMRDGYDPDFSLAAFEDPELGLRLTKKFRALGDDFKVLYIPTATLEHYHQYDVESFIRRQSSCGMMARVFLDKHPEMVRELGLSELARRLALPATDDDRLPIEHYYAVMQGVKSWAIVIEKHYGLGSQNWHGDLLNAVFKLAFLEGYVRSADAFTANIPNGCRYVLEEVRTELNQAIFREALGNIHGIGLV